MQNNREDSLPKIDRWHSQPLDVHKWSEHPEIKELCDKLYNALGIYKLDKPGNRKPKRQAKDMLRVLILDLYVNWIKDPTMSIGFTKRKADYKVSSRYNKVHISAKIIDVEALLFEGGYLEELDGYYDRTGQGRSYSTRLRPSLSLRKEFTQITLELYDIDFDVDRELIILRERFTDELGRVKKAEIEYEDTELTVRLREQLVAYNAILKRTFIDIPSQTEAFIRREIPLKNGKMFEQRISIGPDNKHVHRVFNGTEADNWSKGGRFYGGWWLQIPKEMRKDIYINDKPTVEVDYKALHPNLLADFSEHDPYDLGTIILPDVMTERDKQRAAVKEIILMAINADSANKAFSAFRKKQKTGDVLKKLTNHQLQQLLDGFTNHYPEIKDALNTGKALELMNVDSTIANIVVDYFTEQSVPVLCIHDSFIIQHDKEEELKRVLHRTAVQVAGKAIPQDTKSNKKKIKTYVQGNIEGYASGREAIIVIPNKVAATKEYELRMGKFSNWLSTTYES